MMAEVYCDMSLGTGSNNGTDWTNAYQSLATALTAVNLGIGDNVWVKNAESLSANQTLVADNSGINIDPVRVYGVKSATSATPPGNSDLIPGKRTGQSVFAYADGDAPTLTTTDGNNIDILRTFYMYGINFVCGGTLGIDDGAALELFEECGFTIGSDATADRTLQMAPTSGNAGIIRTYKNCLFDTGDRAGNTVDVGKSELECIGCVFQATTVPTVLFGTAVRKGDKRFIGCDFSDLTNTTLIAVGAADAIYNFLDCQLPSSFTTVSGTRDLSGYVIRLENSDNITGKSSGSVQNLIWSFPNGDIVEETIIVRTGGADDGEAGLHAIAMTPTVNDTYENIKSLVSPWMAFWVTNADTAVDVFIANSGSADYNDDDAWLEVMDVSNSGTAQHTHLTNQMDLLATPAAITDDTGSTWGSGGNNHQKLSVTISPDYSGWSYCRVHFAKNFGASPETLYVDPNPITS